jgi:DNA-binding beta-propeller fold protein YncE
LSSPHTIYVDNDNDQIIYIVDRDNHRIVKWKQGENKGEIVAGGNQEGNQMNQLALPSGIIIDKNNDSLIICDWRNRRVIRWFYQNNIHQQIILANIDCSDVAMDNNKDLYVSNHRKLEVRRWREGQTQTQGTIVADGNGLGDKLNRTYVLISLFVDQNHSVYVSDTNNHRVMQWIKDAKEAIVVAGGQGPGNNLTQLSDPSGLFVDQQGNIYVADRWNHRIMRWSKGSKEGSIIVGGNGRGKQPNQLNLPASLSFDRQGNLYVADYENHRVQKFNIVSD